MLFKDSFFFRLLTNEGYGAILKALRSKTKMLMVTNLKTEYATNPICVPLQGIRFSWNARSDQTNEKQAAYRLIVTTVNEVVWDTGKVYSSDTNGIVYNGQPLLPQTTYFWKVQVVTESGQISDFSEIHTFETTLSDGEWNSAPFISSSANELPIFRKSFRLPGKKIVRARAYVCGLGSYELFINGKLINGNTLTPMLTRYHERYLYNAYDITSLLTENENVFGILLGNGYYAMHGNGVDWQKDKWTTAPWADRPKCKLLAFVAYEDGTSERISTNEAWKTTQSYLTVDEAYYGEEQDLRIYQKTWTEIGFDDNEWRPACLALPPLGKAEPQLAEPCAIINGEPLQIPPAVNNEYVLDAEKITVGWVRLTVDGDCGDEVEISYSEWLDKDGKFSQQGLLSIWDFAGRTRLPQTDYFILSGTGKEVLGPRFQYKGFRYVRIRVKGNVRIENAVLETVYANLPQTGYFACSDDFLNQLHTACKTTLLHNLHSYPSDTPVYENLGYLADGYLTQELAHYNFDAVKFYEKWARDIIDQAKNDGYIEQTAPMWDEDKENATEWSAAIAIVPYQLYKLTGDKTLLVKCYDKAKRVFAYQQRLAKGNIASSMWGDHACSSGKTINEISATASLFYLANILAKSAKLQNKEDEHQDFLAKANAIKAAFHAAFYNEDKGYYCERNKDEFTLNAQVIPYAVGLTDEAYRENIARAIREHTHSFEGGIFSVKYLFPVLTELGLQERLYAWVTSKTMPSWGYFLSFGNGTLWEQWHDYTRSKNHHMFGTVDEWLFKGIGGLEIIDSKNLRIRPYFSSDITWAETSVTTMQGKAFCRWEKSQAGISLTLEIPFNTKATVVLPTENNQPLELGSGVYYFEIKA